MILELLRYDDRPLNWPVSEVESVATQSATLLKITLRNKQTFLGYHVRFTEDLASQIANKWK